MCLDELCEMDYIFEEFWDKFQTKLKASVDKLILKNVKTTTQIQYVMVHSGTKTNEVQSKAP